MDGTTEAATTQSDQAIWHLDDAWDPGINTTPDAQAANLAEPSEPIFGVVTGTVVGEGTVPGSLFVHFPGNPDAGPATARIVGCQANLESGREVALMFEQGDPRRPLLIGPMERPPVRADNPQTPGEDRSVARVEARGQDQITIRCGKSSITLTRSGKIILRGKYILSRSEGVNRIKGGSVQIN